GWVWQTQQTFVVSDTEEEERFPDFLKRYREHNVRSLAILPLTTAQHRLGAMGFGRLLPQRITDTELQFMERVASQVAVAVDNAINFATSQAYQSQLARQRDRYDTEIIRPLRAEGLQAVCCIPLIHHGHTFGTLNLASRRLDFFTPEDVELLQPVAAQIAIAVENALAFKEIEALKNKLAEE